MNIKDITPGQHFTYNGRTTVYKAVRVYSGHSMTSVVYTIPGEPRVLNEIYTFSLATVQPVDAPA